ncbi:MAG: ribosomal protein [Pseudomonadota bacterium]|jgi:large subunit ribosomal protein L21
MYAVIKTSGHQFKVQKGDKIRVNRLSGKVGDKVSFDEVLLVGGSKVAVGAPMVKGARVEGTITEHTHNDKVVIFKYMRRKNYKRTRGHKQAVSVIEINTITGA